MFQTELLLGLGGREREAKSALDEFRKLAGQSALAEGQAD
jgi:hypothetical protein